MIGASLPLLITSAGAHGSASHDAFAQTLMCVASCLTWTSLSVTKLLHKSVTNLHAHMAKALVQALGAGASLLPLLWNDISDLGILCTTVGLNSAIVLAQMLLRTGRNVQPHIPLIEVERSLYEIPRQVSGCS
eukprot:gnl/TRDRNA2_/TRDRNA2_158026_c1_seq2.p1 gnl/TRDRNA2_/TRDRNA2_158026_c1~~gnl/TRDRNA2_/TRDRNA2_158026_c1_seq2.p1  ORF type:complete len:133 (-),score=13.11 gnl/TRDRNA2_/TRDRNA2_158026_c1_seq2:39-437(-)